MQKRTPLDTRQHTVEERARENESNVPNLREGNRTPPLFERQGGPWNDSTPRARRTLNRGRAASTGRIDIPNVTSRGDNVTRMRTALIITTILALLVFLAVSWTT
jgi:hypothetical protein